MLKLGVILTLLVKPCFEVTLDNFLPSLLQLASPTSVNISVRTAAVFLGEDILTLCNLVLEDPPVANLPKDRTVVVVVEDPGTVEGGSLFSASTAVHEYRLVLLWLLLLSCLGDGFGEERGELPTMPPPALRQVRDTLGLGTGDGDTKGDSLAVALKG